MAIDTVSRLKKYVDAIQEEVMCDGKTINSHQVKSVVMAYCEETNEYFSIKSLEPDQLMGCGCWSGIVINLEKDKE